MRPSFARSLGRAGKNRVVLVLVFVVMAVVGRAAVRGSRAFEAAAAV